MEVDLAVLADGANTTANGKLNILGVFDNFSLPTFPATTPTFCVVLRVVGHPSETGKHGIQIRLADADGKELAKLEGQFRANAQKGRSKPYRVQMILNSQVTFPHPGDYTFDVLVDGRWERAIPLEVRKAARS
jgi:hypothetical protein